MLSPTDLGWVAGFLEGEGSFMKCGGTITVAAVQKQKQPLDKIHGLCGGNLNKFFLRSTGNVYHRWQLYGPKAEALMKLLYGLMSPKRQQQIDASLAWYASRPGRNYTKIERTTCRKGHPWVADNIYVYPNDGRRVCRICDKASKQRYLERQAVFRSVVQN